MLIMKLIESKYNECLLENNYDSPKSSLSVKKMSIESICSTVIKYTQQRLILSQSFRINEIIN